MCWQHILTSYKIKLSEDKNLGSRRPSTTVLEEFFISFLRSKKKGSQSEALY